MMSRPLSICPEFVPAVLDGRKTMTRRPINPQPVNGVEMRTTPNGERYYYALDPHTYGDARLLSCPLGAVGDGLWLRERARLLEFSPDVSRVRVRYEATGTESDWLPFPERLTNPGVLRCIPNGVHKEGSRWRGRIVAVRVERVQDITEADAVAEGFAPGTEEMVGGHLALLDARDYFKMTWEDIYGPESWDTNPWVWCVRWEGQR